MRKQLASQAVVATLALALTSASGASAQTVFNFDSVNPLNSPVVSGDVSNFVTSTDFAQSGTNSLRFQDNSPESYESWTYTLPAGFLTGTVSLYFRSDIDAAPALAPNTWGGSFLLEDANDPSDFGAVEISNSTFGPFSKFWASEGSVDRLLTGAGNKFDSNSLQDRDANWHQLTFTITQTITTITVDGTPVDEVAAPGSEVSPGVPRQLRFRHLADSPTNGGSQNYVTTPITNSFKAAVDRVFIDDFVVSQVTPSALTKSITFEVISGTADYDTPVIQSVSPKNDVPEQKGFVNKFVVGSTPANVHAGVGSASFSPGTKRLRQVVFDLSTASPGTINLKFYDALGNNADQNKFGGSIVIQDGITPSTWIAAEIWNFGFPLSSDPTPGAYNYFFSKSISPTGASFLSRYYGNRSVGWHNVDIVLTATTSKIVVDGIENSRVTDGVQFGPGLNNSPKLLILADSASQGGGTNFIGVDELDAIYDDSATITTPYLYYEDLSLPIAPSSVNNWSMY